MRFWGLLVALLCVTSPVLAQGAAPSPQVLESQCAAGVGEACYGYGMLYEAGKQVPEDRAKAARYYDMACDKGSAHGCFELSILYANGTGVPQSWPKAHAYDERACDGGMALACDEAGYDYAASGRGVAHDVAKAQGFYQRAAVIWSRECTQGDADSCRHASMLLKRSDPAQARAQAERAALLWQAACEAGSAGACFEAGDGYDHGSGVARDPDLAAAAYRRSCKLGDARGCNGFGQLALAGHRAGAEPAEIAAALDSRCSDGDDYRCTLLGEAYAAGTLGPRDAGKAMAYFARGCDPGYKQYHTFGCKNLALGYLHGDGVAQDKARAVTMLAKLCEDQGSDCFVLGRVYFRGDAVAQDLGKARDRFEDGCDAGNELSCYALGAMAFEGLGGAVDKALAGKLVAKACGGRRAPEKLCGAAVVSTTFLGRDD